MRLRKKIVREHLEEFLTLYKTEEQILDLGCGRSKYSKFFPNRIGLDHCSGKGVNVIGDAHNLPFSSSSFSSVLSTEMLEHVQDPQRVVNEIERVLEPGGTVILTTRFVFPIHEAPHDYYRFTRYGLAYLFRNWSDVEIHAETASFEGIAVLFQRMGYQSDFYASKAIKGLCFVVARILRWGDVLVRKQYGNYNRNSPEGNIISSGYYVLAKKPLSKYQARANPTLPAIDSENSPS